MKLSWLDIEERAIIFSKKWRFATEEKSEAQSFLNDFFDVFGVDRLRVAQFEKKVPKGKDKNGRVRNGYIDLLWKGIILIEMKSKGKNLDRAYDQAKEYSFKLRDEDLPEYTMVSDFENIRLYRNKTEQIWNFKLINLHKNVKLFSGLTGYKPPKMHPTDIEVDIKAAEKMAKLHDILKLHGYKGHQVEVYLVRLLFCLFADDTGIFEKNIFFDYISNSKEDGSDLSYRISRLFEILDTPQNERDKLTLLSDEMKRFTYINGSLFSEQLPFADFDNKMRKMLLECCTLNWGYISPAIFGSIFQGVMNPKERRELGAYYTSEENILKLIKPLFLNELWEEFKLIKGSSKQLKIFHDKLSKLKFFDPACGCGNFLIITYREIRKLEIEVLKMLIDDNAQLFLIDISPYCKVNINQFYGIEYEEFPCQIAKVGMWLIDHQMNTRVAEHFGLYYARLPLRQSATIIYNSALTISWESIVPKNELSYILGNPPFVGARLMNIQQKSELINTFNNMKGVKNLDYVAAWYNMSAQMIAGTSIKAAFVSTNSITQGEQVHILWKSLFEKYKIHFDFAYRTFIWRNEAKGKAVVHCVIIGFSADNINRKKIIYENDGTEVIAKNINPYIVDASNIFISTRKKPICNVQEMNFGSMPLDGGYFLFSDEEKENFVALNPASEKFFKPFMGADDFINNRKRWCLWLIDANPNELHNNPLLLDRAAKVKEYRASSNREATRKLSSTPMIFGEIRQPNTNYLIIPRHSSQNRNYIPIGFLNANIIAGDSTLIIPNATVYDFGILTSKVHMTWVRTICGRIKSDYRYSKEIVYNNFPWPDLTEKQKKCIEKAAQEVLDVRALYPDSSLSDLYNQLTMPFELIKAHNKVDKAVDAAYGNMGSKSEREIIANLMERYQNILENNKRIKVAI